ncbi:hypothetical protein EJD97_009339 [Solanum chilense]|uniref:Uncharacterized protein n=1 Tax=Solanum chilense TaxID=4083 RepID=A0A6N2BMU0_SOLCI|nr:hypothetical protein EJD97_009339 [Solanum chilense]
MAALACSKTKPFRSISLPNRSHPTTQRVEEVLNKLNGLETSVVAPTSETICDSLLGLEELQKCTDDLLRLPQTFRIISQRQHIKWFEELLGNSVGILDICGTIKEFVSHYKENVRALQCSLRRRKGDSNAEAGIARFTSFSKKMKKDAKRLVLSLKQLVDCETLTAAFLEADQETIAVIRALREANAVCILIFQMLLSFLSVPLFKPKQPKWSLISKLIHNGRTEHEDLENSRNMETKVETFEAQLDDIEKGLEGAFRSLIRSRSSLLNVFSS